MLRPSQFSYSTSQPSINPSTYDGLSTTAFCYHFHITSSAFPVGYAGVFQLWRHKLSTTFLIGSVVVSGCFTDACVLLSWRYHFS